MQFRIGNTLYIGGQSSYHLASGIQGLEAPAFRIGDGLYAGKDGGYVSGYFYGHRTIVIPGFYIGSSCEDADELRKLLFGFLRIRYKLPIVVTDFSNNQYYTEGYVSNIKSNITNPTSGEYQITLLCPDPILYAAENYQPIWKEETLVDDDITTVANEGNALAYPVITIKGITDGISISNDTNEMTMEISVETASADDEIVIDMENRNITLNGLPINQYRSANSTWWYLTPENNDIITDLGTGGATATIKYKTGFLGI